MDSLLGITRKDWKNVQKVAGNTVDDIYIKRQRALNHVTRLNSVVKYFEDRKFQHKIDKTEIKDPIFILGHWRSGTTLLHNIFCLDDQFGFASKFQISNPHTFLTREKQVEKMLANQDAEKRHMDNVEITFSSPDEDETAIAMMCQRSPVLAWAFTKNHDYYAKYHTFEHVHASDLDLWRNAMIAFYKKLTFKYQRPLVLKSPVHLGRMKILYDMFPDARFIHIYREPYRVFQSTQKLYAEALPHTCLQEPDLQQWNQHILDDYKTMYDAYWRDKELIPADRLFEMSFEEFENAKFQHTADIYDFFQLPGFSTFEPKLKKYLGSISDYQKNSFPSLPADIIQRINEAWERSFDKLGYPVMESEFAANRV